MREGRAAKRARGLRVAGPPPLGDSVDRRTKRLIVHRTEAETVRSMFMRAQEGRTPAELAADANASGTKDWRGHTGHWNAKTALRILRNPVYAGPLPDGSSQVEGSFQGQRVNLVFATTCGTAKLSNGIPYLLVQPQAPMGSTTVQALSIILDWDQAQQAPGHINLVSDTTALDSAVLVGTGGDGGATVIGNVSGGLVQLDERPQAGGWLTGYIDVKF